MKRTSIFYFLSLWLYFLKRTDMKCTCVFYFVSLSIYFFLTALTWNIQKMKKHTIRWRKTHIRWHNTLRWQKHLHKMTINSLSQWPRLSLSLFLRLLARRPNSWSKIEFEQDWKDTVNWFFDHTIHLFLSVFLFPSLSFSLSLFLSVFLSLCLSFSLSLFLSVSLSLFLSFSLSLSVSLPLCLSVSLSLCLSVSLSFCLFSSDFPFFFLSLYVSVSEWKYIQFQVKDEITPWQRQKLISFNTSLGEKKCTVKI